MTKAKRMLAPLRALMISTHIQPGDSGGVLMPLRALRFQSNSAKPNTHCELRLNTLAGNHCFE